ncbi:plasmid replication, integration and excision activator [Actinopolymorpha singaporensis]
MAMETRIPVANEHAFPHGAYAFISTEVKPARDFEKSTRDTLVQMIDRDTELPVWTFDVLDADPNAEGKNAAITVRILSKYQPTLPEAPAGSPVRPVEFEGLTGTPYVDSQRCTGNGPGPHRCRSRLAWSWRASAIVAPTPTSAARGPASKASQTSQAGQAGKDEAAAKDRAA